MFFKNTRQKREKNGSGERSVAYTWINLSAKEALSYKEKIHKDRHREKKIKGYYNR